MIGMDVSTINRADLERYVVLGELPNGWRLGPYGMGCFMDPPGYPTYFLQPVYDRSGNEPTPRDSPSIMLLGHVLERVGDPQLTSLATLALWSRLPVDHPRVLAWIESVYQYFQGGYADEDGKTKFWFEYRSRMRKFEDHPGFRDDYRAQEQAKIDEFNKSIERAWTLIKVPARSAAVRFVQKYYPEHEPRLDLLDRRWLHTPPDWWTVLSECPPPEKCPGEIRHQDQGHWRHPVGGSWCQVCGWRKPDG